MPLNMTQQEVHRIIYVILLTKNVCLASKHEKTIRQIQFMRHYNCPGLFKRKHVTEEIQKLEWGSSRSEVFKLRFTEVQSCPFTYILSMAAFLLQETVWPTKPKVFTIWSFTEKSLSIPVLN